MLTTAVLLSACVMLALVSHAQQEPESGHVRTEHDIFTLEEALQRAVETSPTLQIARSETEEAILQRFAVRMERVPEFQFLVGAGPGPIERDRQLPDGTTEREFRYFGGVTFGGEARITAPITTFGKIQIGTQLAELGIDAAELAEEKAIIETRYEAYRAYAGLQWARHMQPILNDVESRLNQAEDLLYDRLDSGDYRARTELRRLRIARADIVELRGELNRARFLAEEAFRILLQVPETVRLEDFDEEVPTQELPDVETLSEYASRHRPDMARLRIAERAAEQAGRLARRSLAPDAFFQARGAIVYTPTTDGVPSVRENPNNFNEITGEVLIGMRWRIQPGQHRARVRLADQRAETVRLQRDGATRGIELQLRDAWMQAESQLELVVALDDARDAAREWMNQTTFQFDQGLADFDDLVEPLRAYYENTGEYFEALLRYRLRVANLSVIIGHERPDALPGWSSE